MKIFEALAGKSDRKTSRKSPKQFDSKDSQHGTVKPRSGNVTEELVSDDQTEADGALSNESSAVTEELVFPEPENMRVQAASADSHEIRSSADLSWKAEEKCCPGVSAGISDLQKRGRAWDCEFAVEYEITYIHTNEVIL